MVIEIIAMGANRISYLAEGERDYSNRLKRYVTLRWKEVKPEKGSSDAPELLLRKEAARLEKVFQRGLKIALDRGGESWSSVSFADHLHAWQNRGLKHVQFFIGGPWGLDENLLRKMDLRLSLSKMTFPHDMVRLILLEQLYRAFTILHREQYHK